MKCSAFVRTACADKGTCVILGVFYIGGVICHERKGV